MIFMKTSSKTFSGLMVRPFGLAIVLFFLESFSPLGAAPPMLKVSGNQIVTANGGCTVRLTGVNCDSLEWDSRG